MLFAGVADLVCSNLGTEGQLFPVSESETHWTEGEERVEGSEGVGSHPLKGLYLTAHQSLPMRVMAPPKEERYDHRCRQTDP